MHHVSPCAAGSRPNQPLAPNCALGYHRCEASIVSQPTRAVITLATSKPIFVEMAFALARSFFYWNRDPGLKFHLVTDLAVELPADLEAMELIRVEPGKLGLGFSPKLHLDSLVPADRTLFIDSDCLCFGPLDYVFHRFEGRKLGVVGRTIASGRWFCDVEATRRRFNLGPLPHFNGGIYYVERGEEVAALYRRAREIEAHYDEMGLDRLRGRPNDEIILSLAMAERGWLPLPEDGTILGNVDTIYPVVEQLDVLSGVCRMVNPPPSDPRHKPGHPVSESRARIVHFLDYGTDKWPYRGEELKIRLVRKHGLPVPLARLAADGTIGVAGRVGDVFRETFRPAYRRLFGTRRIKATEKGTI